jgi:hypothetical protein
MASVHTLTVHHKARVGLTQLTSELSTKETATLCQTRLNHKSPSYFQGPTASYAYMCGDGPVSRQRVFVCVLSSGTRTANWFGHKIDCRCLYNHVANIVHAWKGVDCFVQRTKLRWHTVEGDCWHTCDTQRFSEFGLL